MNADFKPCPFCTGRPNIVKSFSGELHALYHKCPIVGMMEIDFMRLGTLALTWNQRPELK